MKNIFLILFTLLLFTITSCKKYTEGNKLIETSFTLIDSLGNFAISDSQYLVIRTVVREPNVGVIEISRVLLPIYFEMINGKNIGIYKYNFTSIYREFNPLYFKIDVINIINDMQNVISTERLYMPTGIYTMPICNKRICEYTTFINSFQFKSQYYSIDENNLSDIVFFKQKD